MNKQNIKNSKGITLVALIITIVVLLILAIVSLCFRVITYFIQQPYKQKLENKNKIMRNRHLALICGIISITIMFFILWSIEMSKESDVRIDIWTHFMRECIIN